MSVSAMKQALEALENNCTNPVADPEQAKKEDEAITALRHAIAEAEKQEPVAWVCECSEEAWCHLNSDERSVIIFEKSDLIDYEHDGYSITPLYTAPPKREWVGLTDEDLEAVFPAIATYHESNKTLYRSVAHAIEAKLKEKNT